MPPEVQRAIRRAAPSRQRRQRQQRRRRLIVTLAVVLAVVVAVGVGSDGYAHWRFGQIAAISLPGLHQAPAPGKPMVVLVVGSDSRTALNQSGDKAEFGTTQDAGGQRSDVIMLVRIVPAAHKVQILSIPRDLLVPIAGTGGRNKINAAFDRGPEQLIETIQQDLGLPINHYLLINFDGFRSIVNALGGINLNFPFPARDSFSGLRITKTGCQHLGGEQALAVARARHYQYFKNSAWRADPLSDLGRIQRQQTFLRVVLKTGIAKGLTNPLRANQFLGAVVHSLTIDTGLSVGSAVSLVRQFRGFDPNQLGNVTLPTTVANHYQSFGDVLLLKQPDAGRAIASFLGQAQPTTSAPAPAPSTATQVSIRVLNGTTIPGLAARVGLQLHTLGLTTTVAGNAAPSTLTTIRYPSTQQPAARALAARIIGQTQLVADSTLSAHTVSVVLGTTYKGLTSTSTPTTNSSAPAQPTSPPAATRDFDPRPC